MQSTNYAIFNNHRNAQLAHHWLRRQLGADADLAVVHRQESLSHHVIPLRMTRSRDGALGGAAGVGIMGALVLVPALLLVHTAPLLAPVATVALCIGLAAVLGSLAGALAFSTDNSELVGNLRGHLARRHAIVLFPGPHELEAELANLGAIRVGPFDG